MASLRDKFKKEVKRLQDRLTPAPQPVEEYPSNWAQQSLASPKFGDLKDFSWAYRWNVGKDDDITNRFAVTFNTNQGEFTFIPAEVVNKGFTTTDNKQYFFKSFLDKDFQTDFAKNAEFVNLKGIIDPASWGYISKPRPTTKEDAKSGDTPFGYGWSGQGYLVPNTAFNNWFNEGKLNTKSYDIGRPVGNVQVGALQGIAEKDGEFVYVPQSSGADSAISYIKSDGNTYANWVQRKGGVFGSGFIGNFLGDVGDLINSAGPLGTLALNALVPGLGTGVAVGTRVGQGDLEGALKDAVVAQGLSQILPSTDSTFGDAALNSGATAALTGGDVLQSALLGGANASLSGALQDLRSSNSPDYYDFETDSFPDTTKPDYDFKADYSLTSGVSTPSEGFQAPPITGDVFNADGSVDYSLTVPAQNMGFQYTGIPSLPEMGGGQGLVANVPGGTVSQTGFIPTNPSPVIGDPNSFINKEGGTGVVDSVDYGKLLEALLSSGFGAAAMQAAGGGQETAPQPLTPFQPQNTMPVYDDAYFNAIQQNYNALAPTGLMADVATPLREWYVPEQSVIDRLFGDKI